LRNALACRICNSPSLFEYSILYVPLLRLSLSWTVTEILAPPMMLLFSLHYSSPTFL
jgi:hypothetical protein